MSNDTKTVLLSGVGGQGAILAADILSRVAMACGQDVKLSEIHGMAQRGGAVTTVVRLGDSVASMVADKGSVDYLVSFEKIEALRNIEFLKDGGALLVNDEFIKPLPVATGAVQAPSGVVESLEQAGAVLVPADGEELGVGAAEGTGDLVDDAEREADGIRQAAADAEEVGAGERGRQCEGRERRASGRAFTKLNYDEATWLSVIESRFR